jgi:hypothetical protein
MLGGSALMLLGDNTKNGKKMTLEHLLLLDKKEQCSSLAFCIVSLRRIRFSGGRILYCAVIRWRLFSILLA